MNSVATRAGSATSRSTRTSGAASMGISRGRTELKTRRAKSKSPSLIKKTEELTLSFACRVATALSEEESYGCFRLGICAAQDNPETAELLATLDQWTTETVEKLGQVPKTVKLYPLIRENGWSNFKVTAANVRDVVTADGRDWSQLKRGESGTLTLSVKGIWRSDEIQGYGLMVKLKCWVPDETYAPAESDPMPIVTAEDKEHYEHTVTEADVTAAVQAAEGQFEQSSFA
ncbi:hypothetical protein T492DRAFT_854030 [Pavlovales sp. CCMP2436]|nr:hypothetical protein T492DRAFT_854030 [Pavlovales sp. CCMP2436]